VDFVYFLESIRNIYLNHNGLEGVFNDLTKGSTLQESISGFKKIFFELPHHTRTEKHISDPLNGSAAKRINMFTRVISVVN
jgi:hypothetical protein